MGGGSREDVAAVDAGAGMVTDGGVVVDAGPPRPLEVAARRFADDSDTYDSYDPDLGWDGERVSLMLDTRWVEGDRERTLLRMTRFAPDLSSAASLGELGRGWLPRSAWDPARGSLAVCRTVGDPGGAFAELRLHDREGRPVSEALVPEGSGGMGYGVARASDRWAMLHGRSSPPDGVVLRISAVDDRGALVWARDLGEIELIGSSIVADGDAFLVAAVLAGGTGIVLDRIDGSGASLARTVIELPRVFDAAVAVHDDGTIGLLIGDGSLGRGSLRLVRLSHDLETVLGETPLVVEPRDVVSPEIVPTPDGWATTWIEPGGEPPGERAGPALLATLDRTGAPIGPGRVLAPEVIPRTALLYASDALYAAVVRVTARGLRIEVIRLTPSRPGDR